METIKIKYLSDIQKIERFNTGDWIDLRSAATVTIKAGEYAMIPLGVAMELPEGYEALVAPRSSTFKKMGVLAANSIGILAYAMKDTVIHKNERVCQFRLIRHQPMIHLQEVEHLGNADRGGIGSTGQI